MSGGCLEQDVIEVARQVMQHGRPVRRAWCGGSDEIAAWDLGVGCEGEVEILIERLDDARDAERHLLAAEEPFVVVTRVRGDALARLVVSANEVHGSLGDTTTDARAITLATERLGTDGGTLVGSDDDHGVGDAVAGLLPAAQPGEEPILEPDEIGDRNVLRGGPLGKRLR